MHTKRQIFIWFMESPDCLSAYVNSIVQYASLDKSRYQSFDNQV